MNRTEVLDFVKRNSIAHMATVENGEPRVRAMDTPHVDENGLTYCTGAAKNVSLQLQKNPAAELSFWSPKEGLQVRVRGRMEKLDDLELLKHIVETRFSFLKPIVAAHGWEALALFRLSHGEVRTWSMNAPTEVSSQVFPF